jgi:hypothetical protein
VCFGVWIATFRVSFTVLSLSSQSCCVGYFYVKTFCCDEAEERGARAQVSKDKNKFTFAPGKKNDISRRRFLRQKRGTRIFICTSYHNPSTRQAHQHPRPRSCIASLSLSLALPLSPTSHIDMSAALIPAATTVAAVRARVHRARPARAPATRKSARRQVSCAAAAAAEEAVKDKRIPVTVLTGFLG